MNKFKRFIYTFLIIEILLLVVCNFFLVRELKRNDSDYYKVEISRIINEMEQGKDYRSLELSEYPHVVSVRPFDTDETAKNDYAVESIGGELYRFEYTRDGENNVLLTFNAVYCLVILLTIGFCIYLDIKIISPFSRMNSITTELARGNLSVPIKQEKSKYFKEFLWGLDMLREKLEKDKTRELELLKEKKVTVLSLSHDIKTPLSACDLYVKALKRDLFANEEEKAAAIEGIESNVSKIKDYVSEIAGASRDDFLAIEVHNGDVYLSDVMSRIGEYYKEKCSKLHIDFVLEPSENCIVYGDIERIVEVLQNLMENAIKYGDGRTIRISTSDEEECKLITVSNSGSCLPKEESLHIFESFYRGSNCGNVEGSGLGLYICKELMHKMDGDIFVKSCDENFAISIVLQKP